MRPTLPGQTPPITPPNFPGQVTAPGFLDPPQRRPQLPMPKGFPGGFQVPGGAPRGPNRATPPGPPGPGSYGNVPDQYKQMWGPRPPAMPMGPMDGMQYANRPAAPGAGFDNRILGALAGHPMFQGMF